MISIRNNKKLFHRAGEYLPDGPPVGGQAGGLEQDSPPKADLPLVERLRLQIWCNW